MPLPDAPAMSTATDPPQPAVPVPAARSNFFGRSLTRRQSLTLRFGVMFGIVALVAGGVVVYSQLPADEDPILDSYAIPVNVEKLEKLDAYSIDRSYTGVVKARRTSELGFQRGGEIVALVADEGDWVKAGQTLATLDTDKLAAQKEQLAAQVSQAQAVLAELVKGPREEQIEAAKAEMQRASSELSQAKATYTRTAELWKSRAVSRQEYDDSLFRYNAAEAATHAATQKWKELERGTRQEQIDAQESLVKQLSANLKAVEVDIADSTLVAPYDGQISARYVDEGAVQAAGQAVVRLVETGQLEAWVGLPPEVAARFQPGDKVSLAARTGNVEGHVKAVIPEVDPTTRTQTLIVKLPKGSDLVPSAVIRMLAQEHVNQSGFWVPSAALANGTRGLWSVLVAQPTDAGGYKIEGRAVEVLEAGTDRAFVRGTLNEGDLLVTSGLQRLSRGQSVTPNVVDGTASLAVKP